MDRKGCKVLIVDDEPLISMMIEDLVRNWGFAVAGSATSEQEARQLMDRTSPELVILDYMLHGIASLALAELCREQGIPVVFVSGYAQEEIAKMCGNAAVVAKPFTPDDLASAVELAMQGQRAERGPLAQQCID